MQNHYNLVYREEEREMIPLCADQGTAVLPWGPLAGGFLAGNRSRDGGLHTRRAQTDRYNKVLYRHPSDLVVLDRLAEVALSRNVPPAQVALAWLLHKPAVTAPIVGATKPVQIADAVAASTLSLSRDEIAVLEEPYEPHGVVGHF
jgi:aryl-alcohol dehydrogenase (NADP+)